MRGGLAVRLSAGGTAEFFEHFREGDGRLLLDEAFAGSDVGRVFALLRWRLARGGADRGGLGWRHRKALHDLSLARTGSA